MVDIKPNAVNAFLASPPAQARFILCAGRDRGRVKEAADALARRWLGLAADSALGDAANTFYQAQWRSAPQRVVEAALSPSLLGGQRLIRVMDADKALEPALGDWLSRADAAPEALVVAEGGDLAKSDALRKRASADPHCAVLFFYPDEARDVSALIREVLVDGFGLQVERDAAQLLQQTLGADRAISRSELEKLALYVGAGGQVTRGDVAAVVSDAATLDFDALCHAVAIADVFTLDREFHRLIEGGEDVNTILALVRLYIGKLASLRRAMDQGVSFDIAAAKARPPIFWKAKPRFQAAIERWPVDALATAQRKLLDAVVDVRTTGRPTVETTQRALLSVAWLAARGR